MQKNSETVASQLYQTLQEALESGWSLNQIALAAGVPQPSLQDWYTGRRQSLAIKTFAALCAHFGMRLTKAKIGPPPEGRPANRKPKAKKATRRRAKTS